MIEKKLNQPTPEQHTQHSFPKVIAKAGSRIVRMGLLVYLIFCLMLMSLESQLIYMPPQSQQAEAQESGGKEVWFHAEDDTKLHGWYFPNSDSTRALIYFHGNGEDADQNVQLGSQLRDCLNASTLVFDYRGYGQSEGSPFEEGIISDALAAQQWLANQTNLSPNEVILFGRSLGGAVAVAAAARLGAEALVLHSTFSNLDDLAASKYPLVPVRLLMRNPYRSVQRMKHFDGPVLQFHGTNDELIPIEFARPLFAAVTNKKKFVEITNGHHNDPLADDFCEVVNDFLAEIENPKRQP